jgi:hypothetical protein
MEHDYWYDQRYEDMYFGLHGHLPGTVNPECSLCVPDN